MFNIKLNNNIGSFTFNNFHMQTRSATRRANAIYTPYKREQPRPTSLHHKRFLRNHSRLDNHQQTIQLIRERINKEDNVQFLKKRNVLEWLFGESKFVSQLKKRDEDLWGKRTIGYETNQWTTKLGESILWEILYLLGKNPTRVKVPQKGMNNKRLMPDFEADDGMYENKARTYTTSGTAGEKILGTPLKYCEIPRLYDKPVFIVCMAYQEVEADKYFHLFEPMSDELVDILDYFSTTRRIKYVKATDLLKQIATRDRI